MTDLGARRIGVCLGSGFFGFFAHAGVVMALEEAGIAPVAITGCSAGALTGAFWAGGLAPRRIADVLASIRLVDFVDAPLPWEVVGRPGGLLAGRRFERLLARHLPAATFEACRTPFAVTVYDLEDRRLRVVDSGPLAPAVRASCSMPGMFMPAEVDGRASWDGGIVEKVPLAPLASRADVDTILVSFLRHVPPRGLPGSVMAGLREVIHSLVHPSDQRTADEIRSRGKEVLVIAPDVPACGPFRLASGREIVEAAREDTLRILEAERFGCPELG